MDTIEKKMDDLMAIHDWLFPADKLEKQVPSKFYFRLCHVLIVVGIGSSASCHRRHREPPGTIVERSLRLA